MNKQIQSIVEAYADIVSEGVTAKFKSGAKVGIGMYSGDGQYYPQDTGTVTKVSKHGDHEVTFDNQKAQMGDEQVAHKTTFNAGGYSTRLGDSRMIIDKEQHDSNIADAQDNSVRRNDLNTVVNHLNSKRNSVGNYDKLDKTQSDHLKALLDKHTKE